MFSWIYWDPERVIFTIPLIDRPIVWYGVFFAFGFFLGFHLFLRLFKQYLAYFPQITASDIEDWRVFIYGLKEKRMKEDPVACFLYQLFPESIKRKVDTTAELEEVEKKQVIEKLNATLHQSKLFYSYFFEELQTRRWIAALHRYGRRMLPKEQSQLFDRRIFLGEKFAGIISVKKRAMGFGEKLALYVMVGTIIGARLGHLLFYEPMESYLSDPLIFIKTWEGGLASHGGVIGILFALGLFLLKMRKRIPALSFVRLIDFLVIPTALAGAVIRVGNFLNQEVLGKVSTLPWAIVFGHAADGSPPMPRHPAQLYEAIFYLGVFSFLLWFWNQRALFLTPGKLSGLFFLLVFAFRFMIEFLKEPQSALLAQKSGLLMGQWLSIPMVIIGAILFFMKGRERQNRFG